MSAREPFGTAAPGRSADRPRPDRFLRPFAGVRREEVASVAIFFAYALLLLVCYYLLKTLREPLLLAEGSPQIKSYANAAIAFVLLVLVPLYGAAFKRIERSRLVRLITAFFVLNLLLFCCLGRAGIDVAFAYYVWVGVFGVVILAQFWAHTADAFSVESGERVFPAIVAGATLGALLGPLAFRALSPVVGVWPLMLICAALLAATLPLVECSRRAVPAASKAIPRPRLCPAPQAVRGGFALVLGDRYLRLLALVVILLNCVNTTGEYLLAEVVVAWADAQIVLQPALVRSDVIGGFYAGFYFTVNALTLATQVLLVGRVFRWIGVRGAVLAAPIIALIGYGITAFVPIFAALRIVKTLENAADYTLMNTARHALYLPLAPAEKYEGKTAIDAFFWRFGDLLQAGIVYAGVNAFGFGIAQFAWVNVGLALVWLGAAARLARCYDERKAAQLRTSLNAED